MGPTLEDIEQAQAALVGEMVETPVVSLPVSKLPARLADADVTVKLELFQHTNSFKARGAYLGIYGLDASARQAGVVAASGGNHALAVAWSAKTAGVDALIAMPQATDSMRVEACRALGARVELCADMPAAFALMEGEAANGRFLMHPFEGAHMVLGAATIGAEYVAQASDVDVFVAPVGGGGLISGMSAAIKILKPKATVIGVEPIGADSMKRSFEAGSPQRLERIDTIADSLGSPLAMPLTYGIARANVDEIVHITDDDMRDAMRDYYTALRIVAEPACSASLAAVCGPLKDRLAGRRVGIIACGSNIGLARYREFLGD